MAELATIARPYAEAAFALARESKALPAWSDALSMLAAVAADSKVAAAVDNPKLSAEQKHSLFATVMGDKLPAQASKFVSVLLESDRVKLLPQINDQFQALKRKAENVAQATVASAFPLTDAQRADIKAGLAKRYGRDIELVEQTDLSLIGGAKITVGDQVIDRTVVGQLAKMERQIKA
ncbi:MAG: F0F1 ATP synthase subunit delta [Betaproteobacteria bacterium]|nr:MAG: F0F1 ATP synthase subunit delta [Betaproteobacteria bacterium]